MKVNDQFDDDLNNKGREIAISKYSQLSGWRPFRNEQPVGDSSTSSASTSSITQQKTGKESKLSLKKNWQKQSPKTKMKYESEDDWSLENEKISKVSIANRESLKQNAGSGVQYWPSNKSFRPLIPIARPDSGPKNIKSDANESEGKNRFVLRAQSAKQEFVAQGPSRRGSSVQKIPTEPSSGTDRKVSTTKATDSNHKSVLKRNRLTSRSSRSGSRRRRKSKSNDSSGSRKRSKGKRKRMGRDSKGRGRQ